MSDVVRSPRALTYCSFVIAEVCAGVCVLEGELGPVEAAVTAHMLGINPGGELLAISCRETEEGVPLKGFEALWENRNRLISVAESRELFETRSIKEWEEEAGAASE